MKKRILSIFMAITMVLSTIVVVSAEENAKLPKVGAVLHGFKVMNIDDCKMLDAKTVLFEHKKTGGQLLFVSNNDTDRAFDIAFRTPAYDTGISHVFEHSSISGSEKYPANIFFNVSAQTVNTYMNAYTTMKTTSYPLSSISDEQLLKLSEYYLDGVFKPLVYKSDETFQREGWRYEMESADSDLTINGTVYNEMKGNQSNSAYMLYMNAIKTMFPNSNQAAFMGGNPEVIPEMTNEDLKAYHSEYYRPSNALAVLYGNADYEKYLELLDSYFSEFDDTKADLSDKDYKSVKGHIEKTFTSVGTESGKSSIAYAIPCKTDDENEILGLIMSANILSSSYSAMLEKVNNVLPNVNLSISFDVNLTEPCLLFLADNIDAKDKDLLKDTIDSAIKDIVKDGFSKEIVDAFEASIKRSTLTLRDDSSNLGIGIIQSINNFWAIAENPEGYFDYLDYISNFDSVSKNKAFEKLLDKYVVNSDSSAIVINVPDPDFTAKKDAQQKEKLAAIKEKMTDEEIDEIVRKTTEPTVTDDKTVNELLKQINVSSVENLKSDLENYKEADYPIDDKTISGVRYLSAKEDIGDIGIARAYFDISELSTEQLLYFQLYTNLIGELPTKNHTTNEMWELIARYFSGGMKILPTDDTLYYAVNTTMLNEDIEQAYNVIYEMLFEQDCNAVEEIESVVNRMISATEQNISANPLSLLITRAQAQYGDKAAYYSYMEGLDFYEFLKQISEDIKTNPNEVVEQLKQVQNIFANSYNASTVYAGNDEGIKLNEKYSQKFFEKLTNRPHEKAEHDIPRISGNEAIIINSDVNYNLMLASLDVSGADRDGGLHVTQNLIHDKFLKPQLRDNKGAYGCLMDVSEYGIYVCSYRDPQLEATYDYYEELPELMEETEFTKEEVDRYIMSTFSSQSAMRGPLSAAYHKLTQEVYTSEKDNYEILAEILETTPQNVSEYAEVYRKLIQDGVISTIGKESDIRANSDLFDSIIIPFGSDKIKIVLNNQTIETEVDPIIENDSTLVPLRAIFEAMGCTVEWNQQEEKITVSNGDVSAVLYVGSYDMDVNGNEVPLEVAPKIVDERTLVPLRAISEAMECDVNWIGESKTVRIVTK